MNPDRAVDPSQSKPKTDPQSGLVSVITPAYNSAAYIAETLATVQAQTCPEWEWIVADDGSTDRTADLLARAAQADPRIRLIRLEHTGLAARVRNAAMAAARGEFFAFLDADDLWESDKLQRQVDYLREHPQAGGVCNWFDMFGYHKRVQNSHVHMNPQRVIGHRDFVRGMPMWMPTVMMRRLCYDQVGGFDEDPRLYHGQDHEYFARLTLQFEFHRIPEVLTHVRIHPPGRSRTAGLGKDIVKMLNIADVLLEKGLISPGERRVMYSRGYYSQATDNLFFRDYPWRGHLVRSVLSGRPPLRAVVMLSLAFLPAALLRPLLARMQRWVKRQPKTSSPPRSEPGDAHA